MHYKKYNKYKVSAPDQRRRDGRTFDSKAEMMYYDRLKLLVSAGEVLSFCYQPFVHLGGELWYRPDFFVLEETDAYYVDVKGVVTPAFRKIYKVWPQSQHLQLKVVQYKGGSFVETTL